MRSRCARAVSPWAVAALVVTVHGAAAASPPEPPQSRTLDATELFAEPGLTGSDFSANAPSLSGLSLLATIPTPSGARAGFFIQAQCTAGLEVVFDDAAGSQVPTIVVLAGASANGGQGASLDMGGMPHTGRIRIYSSSASCQMAARAW